MALTRIEAKIIIAKFLELAYSEDKGMTVKIMANKSGARLTIDQSGKATLTGTVGTVIFSGATALDRIGVKIKRISISFNSKKGTTIGYRATFDLVYMKLSVMGDFDMEDLIMSCSGLLCRAARALKGRHHAYDLELQKIMGH